MPEILENIIGYAVVIYIFYKLNGPLQRLDEWVGRNDPYAYKWYPIDD